MHKIAILFLVSCLLTLNATARETGIGIILGEPTGLTGKHWLDKNTAIAGAAAWSLSKNESLHLHADYLRHNFQLIKGKNIKGQLPVHYGLGVSSKLKEDKNNDTDIVVGLRLPVGLTWLVPREPVDVFVELVPEMELLPDTHFNIGLAIGARYYFK